MFVVSQDGKGRRALHQELVDVENLLTYLDPPVVYHSWHGVQETYSSITMSRTHAWNDCTRAGGACIQKRS